MALPKELIKIAQTKGYPTRVKDLVIGLTCIQANAYEIMGAVRKELHHIRWSKDEQDLYLSISMSGDYERLCEIAEDITQESTEEMQEDVIH